MIQLNYRDTRPFYQQIKDNIRHLLINRAIHTDEPLPTVREMTFALAINPRAIRRAYYELEREGYIYTVTGKGLFASELCNQEESRRLKLLEIFDRTASELLALSCPAAELGARLLVLAERRENA